MDTAQTDTWANFNSTLDLLKKGISRSKAANVNAANLRQQAKDITQLYFRQIRPEIQSLGIGIEIIGELDTCLQNLLKLSNGGNAKKSYLTLFKNLSKSLEQTELAIELRYAEKTFLSLSPQSNILTGLESIIYDTLLNLVPNAALSYKQAIVDLGDKDRVSYRGIANEFREALRETLDYLAPDKDVEAQPNFKYEKDKTTPTMKQKVRYIFKARGLTGNAMKVPENAVEIIEERVASFARSTYERSSISTHVASSKNEVLQIRNYLNAVLAELLGLQV
jgi:hypothetical protein